ncbi:hypothetical protein EVAR_20551_1 [Eumeta japonica]|uniref:Uncharacterized protein n=1 Tax=Eumeta variegata TaxID=151549 RepID=A0A4C1USI8_EUMVA|nr:hypothetical protein EVAR_20551_1 [Eumeta japonica]
MELCRSELPANDAMRRAFLRSTSLQLENGSARPVKYTLTEYRREVTASDAVFLTEFYSPSISPLAPPSDILFLPARQTIH